MITPCLWFDNEAEDAALFYVSIFKNSEIRKITKYGKEGFEVHGKPEGSVMTIEFTLDGQDFTGLNGGPFFRFNEAISFQVMCDTQDDIDYYWNKLKEGGSEGQCGWLKDKYGLSWQIIPAILPQLLEHPERASRVTDAYLKMQKMDIEILVNA